MIIRKSKKHEAVWAVEVIAAFCKLYQLCYEPLIENIHTMAYPLGEKSRLTVTAVSSTLKLHLFGMNAAR